jgi:hypothetical protein
MKNLFLIVSLAALTGCGCAYNGVKTPLQRGDSIIFDTADRANAFRTVSGNDAANGGRVVAITAPTVVFTE